MQGRVVAEDMPKWQKRLLQFVASKKAKDTETKHVQRKIHFGKRMAPNLEQVAGLDPALRGGVGCKFLTLRETPPAHPVPALAPKWPKIAPTWHRNGAKNFPNRAQMVCRGAQMEP